MSYEPTMAAGTGSKYFDLPGLFFLTHQEQIEQWYGLREQASNSTHKWYGNTVRNALGGPARDRGLSVSNVVKGPRDYRHVLLHTPSAPILDGGPIIGVGFGWSEAPGNASSQKPFVCVRVSHNATGEAARDVFMRSGGAEFVNSSPTAKENGPGVWPVWWWLNTPDTWWADLDGFCDHIVAEVEELVDAVRPALDAASAAAVLPSDDESK